MKRAVVFSLEGQSCVGFSRGQYLLLTRDAEVHVQSM